MTTAPLQPPLPATGAPRPVRVCRAGLRDATRLTHLFAVAHGYTADEEVAMADWLEHGGALLVEDRAGQALCGLRWRECEGGWRLDPIATLPEARGHGYGRWLMTGVEAMAIRQNVGSLTMTLPETGLLAYYERMGYACQQEAEDGITIGKRVGGTWQLRGQSRA